MNKKILFKQIVFINLIIISNKEKKIYFMTELTFNQYPFLAELGLAETNAGSYVNGRWFATGTETLSYNPSTGKAIAKIT
jgi:hypothetical protein